MLRKGLEQGRAVGGRYVVAQMLGEGARKRVYRARDTRLEREVALAWIDAGTLDEVERERTRREAHTLGRLGDHPNVVAIHDFGEEADGFYFATQLMEGGSLAELLAGAPTGRLGLDRSLSLAADLAAALEHAHAQGILHRDVKPANLWLSEDGRGELGDFGLALFADHLRLTDNDLVMGTAHYVAPEQARGEEVDARTDLYSMGATLYEMIAGRPPFLGDSALAVLSQHLHADPVAVSWHNSSVPPRLERLIHRLLAKSRFERPPNARAVRVELEAISRSDRRSVEGKSFEPANELAPRPSDLRGLAPSRFIGRRHELSQLKAAVDESVAGNGLLLALAGEPGIGKTRTSEEVATYASLRGAQVLVGRCHETDGAPAYWPWMQVIRTYVHDRTSEELAVEMGSAGPHIAQVVSEVRAKLPDLAEPSRMEPDQARFRLFDSVTTFLGEAALRRPLVIVLEDLHWADDASLKLLEFVARELGSKRILVLLTYRDVELVPGSFVAATVSRIRRESVFRELTLGAFDEADVRSMVSAIVDGPVPEPLVRTIVRDGDGNPFFVQEILRYFVEEGRIDAETSGVGTDLDLSGTVPEGAREIVTRRIDRLDSESVYVLSVGAVIGREFELTQLERVSGLGRSELIAHLDEAVAHRVINKIPGRLGSYRFGHALVREGLYEGLSSQDRLTLHGRYASELEQSDSSVPDSRVVELAHHYFCAALDGYEDKAVQYASLAAERAMQRVSYEEAIEHYGRVLEVLRYLDGGLKSDRCNALLGRGTAEQFAGLNDRAKATFLEAADLAREACTEGSPEGPTLLGRAAFGLGNNWGLQGVLESKVVELLEEAIGHMQSDGPLHARLLGRLAVAYYWSDEVARRDELSLRGLEMAERLGDRATLGYALNARRFAVWGPDRLEERLELDAAMIRLGEGASDPSSAMAGHFWRIIDRVEQGDIRGADADLASYAEQAERGKVPYFLWCTAVARAMRALLDGRLDEGEQLAADALRVGHQGESENAEHFFGVQTYQLLRARGGLELLEAPVRGFVERYPAIPSWRGVLATIYASMDRPEDARREYEHLAQSNFSDLPRDANFLVGLVQAAEVCAYLRDTERAPLLYDLLAPYAAHNVVAGNAAGCFGVVAGFLAGLAAVLDRKEAAREHFEAALKAHEEMGACPLVAQSRLDYGRWLLEGGADEARARPLLEAAAQSAAEIGMRKVEAEARQLLGVLDGDSLKGQEADQSPTAGDLQAVPGSMLSGDGSSDSRADRCGTHVFRIDGDYWTLTYRGETSRMKNAKGFHYLRSLLMSPGRPIHALELVAPVSGDENARLDVRDSGSGLAVRAGLDAGALLDERAKQQYRQRVEELRSELDEAEGFHDLGRAERIREELDALVAELSRGVGLGGRDRPAASEAERARLNVTRAIRSVLRKLHEANPGMADHFSATVKTGTFCSYTPDPGVAIDWVL